MPHVLVVFINFHHIIKAKILFLLYPIIRMDDLCKIPSSCEKGEVNYSFSSHRNILQPGPGKLLILYTTSFSVINGITSSIMLDCYPNGKGFEKPQTSTAEDPPLQSPRKTGTLQTAAYKETLAYGK